MAGVPASEEGAVMSALLDRRRLLRASAALGGLGLAGLGGCATVAGPAPRPAAFPVLQPIRARPERLFDLTVCLRPFRAMGPRLDAERVGDALVVHNYGHGGSGWSLSWGSAEGAVRQALAGSPEKIAIVGCGALGLTSAITAQRAGARVTIYARELLPQTRSARATGMFTPDSRIALANAVSPGFPALWEQMARTSFHAYRNYLGLPGRPVEFIDNYLVSADVEQTPPADPKALQFADYRDRILDLRPRGERLAPDTAPFQAPLVRRNTNLMFNIADYGHTLMTDFLLAGGQIRHREFHAPAEYGQLEEKVVINCTGYGARALWKDESIVPVRGQIGWLIPQPEVDYGLAYRDVNVVPRRDGIVVQVYVDDMQGYGDDQEVVDLSESERGVAMLAEAMTRLKRA
jgi:glycine/D-amino acid oxidase-like deaminating enzyme